MLPPFRRLAGREPPRFLPGYWQPDGQGLDPRRQEERAAALALLAGALVIEPGDEVIAGDQVRHDGGGVIPQQGWQITEVQDVRKRHVLADPGQRELVQFGERRLQSRQGLDGEVLCQRCVALYELA